MFDLPFPDIPNFMFSIVAWLSLAYFFFKTKGYAKKSAEYAADLKYLPRLTQEIEKIKADLHSSTEIHLGLRGEEREVIFKLTTVLTDIVNNCLYPISYIKDSDDIKEIKRETSTLDLKLLEFQLLFSKLEILCEDQELLKSANNCYEIIVKKMIPLTHKFLVQFQHYKAKYDLIIKRTPLSADTIKDIDREDQEYKKIYQTFTEDIIEEYRDFVSTKREYINAVRKYLSNQFDSDSYKSEPPSETFEVGSGNPGKKKDEAPEASAQLDLKNNPAARPKESIQNQKESSLEGS